MSNNICNWTAQHAIGYAITHTAVACAAAYAFTHMPIENAAIFGAVHGVIYAVVQGIFSAMGDTRPSRANFLSNVVTFVASTALTGTIMNFVGIAMTAKAVAILGLAMFVVAVAFAIVLSMCNRGGSSRDHTESFDILVPVHIEMRRGYSSL